MGTIYTSTIQVNVWKEHTCACCGCKYRYLFKRKKQGQGGDPKTAGRNAEKAVVRALEKEVDMMPCPECGLYQPDMVAARRTLGHWIVFGVAAAPWLLVLILAAASALSLASSAWACAVIFALTLVCHMAIDVFNPNANLESNREVGQRRLESGDIWMDDASKPDPNGEPPHTGVTAAMLLLYALLAACALFAALPELIRAVRGWPLNTKIAPCVAGPGDQITIWFPGSVSNVTKGLWNGTVNARAVPVEGDQQPVNLTATTNNGTWSNTISVGSKESKSSTITPWAYVTLPNDASLANKPIKLIADITVRYPMYQGNTFQDTSTNQHGEWEIKLASPGAGGLYRTMWYMGVLGGGFAVLILGMALAFVTGALRNQAHPTEIFVPERPEIEG